MGTEPISRFFDREAEACCREDADLGDGVAGVSGILLDQVERAGLEGRTVLDLGCGTGGFLVEALRRGAARGAGIDISPVSVDAARRRARVEGVASRTTFEVGDASDVELEAHDVVVLNKSICCYPNADRLVESSVASAGSVYAFSVPASRGIRGLVARTTVAFENAWRWIRRDPFRAFVHPVARLDSRVRAAGLERVVKMSWWTWQVAVYVRPAADAPA